MIIRSVDKKDEIVSVTLELGQRDIDRVAEEFQNISDHFDGQSVLEIPLTHEILSQVYAYGSSA